MKCPMCRQEAERFKKKTLGHDVLEETYICQNHECKLGTLRVVRAE